jgi:ubiquinone/menaquinone biosynthesis C-methylase UbiE
MKINAAEKMMVNNPARRLMLHWEIDRMRTWAPDASFKNVLEIGCGSGGGVLAIDRVLRPTRIHAFDLDEHMVELARGRTGGIAAELDLRVAAGEAIPYSDASMDAVFELTIFHHIPDWRAALAEVHRVLRPGGVFFFEELAREYHFNTPVLSFIQQNFTAHPWDTIPDTITFLDGIRDAGLKLLHTEGFFFPGWIMGAAQKPG